MTHKDFLDYRKKQYYDVITNKLFGSLTGLVSVELNITELCNRKCSFCPRSNPQIYPNQKLFMSADTIKRIAQELQKNNFSGWINFCGFGEPLLHPDIIEIIKIIKAILPMCKTELTTNTDFINVEFLNNVKDLLDNIIFDCYDGEHQIDKLQDLLKKTNYTKYIIKELWSSKVSNTEVIETVLNNRSGAVNIQKQTDNSKNQCFIPFYKMIIDWNGDMLLCCNDWFRKQKNLGNIYTNNIQELWFGPAINSVRKNLKKYNRLDAACKDCNVCGTIIGKESMNLLS